MSNNSPKTVRLGDAATFVNGYPFKPETWAETGIPIIRIQNLNNSSAPFNYFNGVIPDKYLVTEGDILVSWSASLGAYEWRGGKAYLNQHIFKVVFNKIPINKYYLRYAIESQLSAMSKDAHGSTMKHIVKSDFDNTRIPYPTLSQQHTIVVELDAIKGIVEKKRAQLDYLDKLEISLFYDSFGNPVTNTRAWKILSLSEITKLITDGSHYSPKDEEVGTIPMLSVKNMGARGFDYTDCKMISQEEFKKLEAAGCKPMPDDVLVAKDGSYFKKIFVHQSEAPQAILSSIAIVRPDQMKVTPEFLCSLLSTPDIYNLVEERYLTGTAIKRVILKGLRQLKIIVPPMEMQKQFSKKIWRINAQRRLIEESVVEAQKLFDSRMNYYFGD